MIVYGSPLSPFVRKILAVAAEKGLEIELKPGGMGQGGAEFAEASPFGKMPGFRDGDFVLADSSAIAHYIDTAYPDMPLLPAEAKSRGRTIWFDEFADTILMVSIGKMFFNRIVSPLFMKQPGNEALAAEGEAEMPRLFEYLESVVPASGFLVDDRLTLADISVATTFVNLRHLGMAPDAGTYPKLAEYIDAMLSRPAFAKWIAIEAKAIAAAR